MLHASPPRQISSRISLSLSLSLSLSVCMCNCVYVEQGDIIAVTTVITRATSFSRLRAAPSTEPAPLIDATLFLPFAFLLLYFPFP